MRVQALDANGVEVASDISNTNFTISTGALPPPALAVTEPLAGATWTAGTTRNIRWTVSGDSPPQIGSFVPEVSVDGTNFTALPQAGSAVRSANWTLPSNALSNNAKVRVRALSPSGLELNSTTSAAFRIVAPSVLLPVAHAVVNRVNPAWGENLNFSADQSRDASGGQNLTYAWNFGGYGTSSQKNPTFAFAGSGATRSVVVRLTVTDAHGQTDSTTVALNVGSTTTLSMDNDSSMSADPVNLATGNYTYDHSDLRLPGPGVPFEFKRHYNSQAPIRADAALGARWTHSYEIQVLEDGDGNVSLVRGDGNTEAYIRRANGTYQPEAGIYDTLAKRPDGTFTLTTKDQIRHDFEAGGRLKRIVDRNGNTLTLIYNGTGLLQQIEDSAGRVIPFTHDAAGRITGLTDPLGKSITFTYDAAGDLVTATNRRGGATRYAYDGEHQFLHATDPNGNRFVENVYDEMNRVVTSQQDALGGNSTFTYDFNTHTTIVVYPLNTREVHRHDERLRVISVTDARGHTERYEYDANNNRTKVTDKRGFPTIYTYDSRGNVTGKIDALGQKTAIQYDAKNRPILRRDAVGAVTGFTYDFRGNLVATKNPVGFVTRAEYDARGLAVKLTDPLGRITQQTHDAAGNLIRITDALGGETGYEYDDAGRRTAMVDANDARTTFEYDADDHVTRTVDPLGHGISSVFDPNGNQTETTDQRGNTTKFTYDAKDRLTEIENALGQKTTHSYDALDRKIATTDARNHTSTFRYDPTGNLTATKDPRNNETWFAHDENGNRVSITNAIGETSWTEYDPLNRPVRSGDPLGNVVRTAYDAADRRVRAIDPLGRNTTFKFDLAGRLLSVTDPAGGAVRFTYDKVGNRLTLTDQRGNTTRYAYDALNRPERMREPQGGETRQTYDAVGNRIRKTDPNGQETHYFYSPRRTLDRILYADAGEVTFTYDPAGNRIAMGDRLGSSSWQYDALNRVTTHTDAFGKSLGYGYDPAGNRSTLTYPGNKVVTYTYDEAGRMSSVTDWENRTSTYTYDPVGRPVGAGNPNGTTAALTYDDAGRVIELTHTGPANALIASYAFSLDAVGNHRHVQQTEPLEAFPPEEDTLYRYDKDNRLIQAGNVTFAYDTNGNTTRRGGDTYGYDATDRLATAQIDGTTRAFGYDGMGNRLVRTVGGVTTRFVVDLNSGLSRILCETDASGTITAYYVHGLNLVSRIAADGSVRYYHGDVRGSTVALTNGNGAVTDKYAYDEFGVPLAQEGSTANPFRYLGRAGIYDDGNDLLHVRARYFSPSLGRFHSKDPFPATDENGQTLHRYAYAMNNPIRLIDINGFSSKESSFSIDTNHLLLAHSTPSESSSFEWSSLVPTYGNNGGLGYTMGLRGNSDLSYSNLGAYLRQTPTNGGPKDEMDRAFAIHDVGYGSGTQIGPDVLLLSQLQNVSIFDLDGYGITYKFGAEVYFTNKVAAWVVIDSLNTIGNGVLNFLNLK